jgi:AcrR family transcriptional regulator
LSRERIVTTALRILDEDGLVALSMRRIASELDTGVMSLYWYFENKDHLLALLVDEVFASVEPPRADGEWKAELRRYARRTHRVLYDHPGLGAVFGRGIQLGPHTAATLEAVLRLLRTTGLGRSDAVDAFLGLTALMAHDWLPPTTRGAVSERAARAWSDLDALSKEEFPVTVSLANQLRERFHTAWFNTALDCFLDGLEQLIAVRTRRLADA